MWTIRGLTPVVALIGMILNPIAFSSTESDRPRSQSQPSDQKQIVEYVLSKECVDALTPGIGFEIRIPVDEKGQPALDKWYMTGPLAVTLKKQGSSGCIVRYNISRQKEK